MCDFFEPWKISTCHCCGEKMGQINGRILEKTGKIYQRKIVEEIN
jgi:hypothetical protein